MKLLILLLFFVRASHSKLRHVKCLVEVDEIGPNYVRFLSDYGKVSVSKVSVRKMTRVGEKLELGREMAIPRADLFTDHVYPYRKFQAIIKKGSDLIYGDWLLVCANPTRESGCEGECAIVRFCECHCGADHRLFLRMVIFWTEAVRSSQTVQLTTIMHPKARPEDYIFDVRVDAALAWLHCANDSCKLLKKKMSYRGEKGRVRAVAKSLVFTPPFGIEAFDLHMKFAMNVSEVAELLGPHQILDQSGYTFDLPTVILGRYGFRNTSLSLVIPFDNPGSREEIRETCYELRAKDKTTPAPPKTEVRSSKEEVEVITLEEPVEKIELDKQQAEETDSKNDEDDPENFFVLTPPAENVRNKTEEGKDVLKSEKAPEELKSKPELQIETSSSLLDSASYFVIFSLFLLVAPIL